MLKCTVNGILQVTGNAKLSKYSTLGDFSAIPSLPKVEVSDQLSLLAFVWERDWNNSTSKIVCTAQCPRETYPLHTKAEKLETQARIRGWSFVRLTVRLKVKGWWPSFTFLKVHSTRKQKTGAENCERWSEFIPRLDTRPKSGNAKH